ncbi:MAG: AAA family ATPase [Verrucomicrobiota bacterium]
MRTGISSNLQCAGGFAKRVCVLGAESTGSTTLAKGLAEHFQTAWVEKDGREYSEVKLAKNDPDLAHG